MKHRKSIWYYLSIAGIAFSLGAIIYGIVTSEYIVIGRLFLLLGLSIYTLTRYRKPREETETARSQEEDKQG